MSIDPISALLGTASPWEWWRGVDDLWRWGLHAQKIWAYDAADEARRAEIRRERLAGMIEHARTRSAFYRAHWRHVPPGCEDLSAYPPVSRGQLMANFDDWVIDPNLRKADLLKFVADPGRIAEPYLGKYAVWTSSGTTGMPGIYVQDADALALYSALMTCRFDLGASVADPRALVPEPARLAFIAAVEGHFAGVVSWERQRRIHPAIGASARAFSILQPLSELVAALNDWRPAFVASYPTMLMLLARERAEGRLAIEPRALWCGGEGLTQADRAAIEGAFGCPVVEDYGASECMNMAFACRHGRLHVNDDWVVLEPVDEQGRPVPPGEASASVLVTNLANRVQPLVRYDLSDSVTLDASPCPCGCGRPSVRIEGRRDDVLLLRRTGQGKGEVRILPLAIETVIEEQAGVYRFQLMQTAPDAMSLRIEVADDAERAKAFTRVKRVLARYLKAQGAAPVALSLDLLPPEANPVSGKLRQVRALPPGSLQPTLTPTSAPMP